MFGPAVGALFNGSMDILKFLAKPTGGVQPRAHHGDHARRLYLRLLFLRKPLRPWRVLAAQFCVALFCNVILNTYFPVFFVGERGFCAAAGEGGAESDHMAGQLSDIFLSGQNDGDSRCPAAFGLKTGDGKEWISGPKTLKW